jgi:Zn-dependent peptidase ImmA (M78 family)
MGAMSNNKILKIVREQRGLEMDAVALSASISSQRLAVFEKGDGAPSRKQMERLAEIYGVPLYALSSSSIPNLPPLPQDFRKVDPAPATLSPRGMKTLWLSERISRFTAQLAIELKFTALNLASSAKKLPPKKSAAELRSTFEAWLEPRAERFNFSGPTEQKFLSALRLFFEFQGGVLNIKDAPAQDYLGFFLEPDGGMPTIFVNRSVLSKKAQLFTLAHEYAHSLIDSQGISNPFAARNSTERACNVFAAEFLAPMDKFAKVVESLSSDFRHDVAGLVSAVSARSLLSMHATAIRLVEAEFISQGQLRSWLKLWSRRPYTEKEEEKEENDSPGGGNPHAKRISEIGHLSVYLAARAVAEKLIDRHDVSAGIGLSETLQERAFSLAKRRFEIAAL